MNILHISNSNIKSSLLFWKQIHSAIQTTVQWSPAFNLEEILDLDLSMYDLVIYEEKVGLTSLAVQMSENQHLAEIINHINHKLYVVTRRRSTHSNTGVAVFTSRKDILSALQAQNAR